MPVPDPDATLPELFDLLISGGDERLHLDPATGNNRYGTAPFPRGDTLELGSCTISSMSPGAQAAAEQAFAALAEARARGALGRAAEDACDAVRGGLLSALGLDDLAGVDAVLTPSGTDAELIPLALAAGRTLGRLRNVVVGPGEAGSGTVHAAGGLHPYAVAPLGGRSGPRTPVAGGLPERTRVHTVAIRDDEGTVRPPGDVEAEVEALADEGVAAGEVVLVHRIAHSKTGVFAPGTACLRRLAERHGDRVLRVVDAAQGRIGRAALRAHLMDGDVVILTGSKFYGGPPFSGAVLVPEQASPSGPLPEGLRDYLSLADLPPAWRQLAPHGARPHNLGLLIRWIAALFEIRAYRALPAAVQREIIEGFGASVRRHLGEAPAVSLLDPAPIPDAAEGEPHETLPTVFCFAARDGDRELGMAELEQLARRLSPWFHLGQPVRLGAAGSDTPAVLRVAIGAPLACALAADPRLGRRLEGRIAWLDHRLGALAEKLDRFLSPSCAA